MTMISPNVMRAVGEVLGSHEDHAAFQREDGRRGGKGAVCLRIGEATRWLEALGEGCTVEEANVRVRHSHPSIE